MDIRKIILTSEEVLAEAGDRLTQPVRRAAGIVVITNPFAGRSVDDLKVLFDVGLEVGTLMMKRVADLLGAPPISYGKAAIVGTSGEVEHGAAIVHPRLGKPMREWVGGGEALIT